MADTKLPDNESNALAAADEKTARWRDVIKVHPAAELLPEMSESEFQGLVKDIEKNWLLSPIVLWKGGEPKYRGRRKPEIDDEDVYLLDGRHRLDALEEVREREPQQGTWPNGRTWTKSPFVEIDDDGRPELDLGEDDIRWVYKNGAKIGEPDTDPYEYVVSANIHRRHLTTAQKGELIEALLKAKPERSDTPSSSTII
jgi:hypothetical protein